MNLKSTKNENSNQSKAAPTCFREELIGMYSKLQIDDILSQKKCFVLNGKRPVLIGKSALLKVNVNVGVSSKSEYNNEVEKIKQISSLSFRPDSMMDLSIVRSPVAIWEILMEYFDGAIGTVPYYSIYNKKTGLSEKELLSEIELLARRGISFMTLHPTADINIYNKSKNSRTIPMTSRGGFILIRDQIINSRKSNLIAAHFDEIMSIFKQYNVCLSVGAAFRPGNIKEALDVVHLEEIKLQKHYIDIAKKNGVNVIMECIGHCSLNSIPKYAQLVKKYNTPLMPLGPMLSDETIGFDHVNSALGSMALAQTGLVGIINSVTREEHTGNVPSLESIIEGLKTAQTVAHIYNASKYTAYQQKTEITGQLRGRNRTCVQAGGLFDYMIIDNKEISTCTRCSFECPLKL